MMCRASAMFHGSALLPASRWFDWNMSHIRRRSQQWLKGGTMGSLCWEQVVAVSCECHIAVSCEWLNVSITFQEETGRSASPQQRLMEGEKATAMIQAEMQRRQLPSWAHKNLQWFSRTLAILSQHITVPWHRTGELLFYPISQHDHFLLLFYSLRFLPDFFLPRTRQVAQTWEWWATLYSTLSLFLERGTGCWGDCSLLPKCFASVFLKNKQRDSAHPQMLKTLILLLYVYVQVFFFMHIPCTKVWLLKHTRDLIIIHYADSAPKCKCCTAVFLENI